MMNIVIIIAFMRVVSGAFERGMDVNFNQIKSKDYMFNVIYGR